MSNTRIEIVKGEISNQDAFNTFLRLHSDGSYLVATTPLSKPRSIEEWRNLYFALRDIVYSEGETGLTKEEIHEDVKKNVMPLLMVDDGNWAVNKELITYTTTLLTEHGWENFVKEFKSFAQNNYNCYL